MRTTVRLPDSLLRQAKRRAADTGKTLTALIEDGLRAILSRPPIGETRGPDLPSTGAGGLRPGVDLDSSAALYDLMDDGG